VFMFNLGGALVLYPHPESYRSRYQHSGRADSAAASTQLSVTFTARGAFPVPVELSVQDDPRIPTRKSHGTDVQSGALDPAEPSPSHIGGVSLGGRFHPSKRGYPTVMFSMSSGALAITITVYCTVRAQTPITVPNTVSNVI